MQACKAPWGGSGCRLDLGTQGEAMPCRAAGHLLGPPCGRLGRMGMPQLSRPGWVTSCSLLPLGLRALGWTTAGPSVPRVVRSVARPGAAAARSLTAGAAWFGFSGGLSAVSLPFLHLTERFLQGQVPGRAAWPEPSPSAVPPCWWGRGQWQETPVAVLCPSSSPTAVGLSTGASSCAPTPCPEHGPVPLPRTAPTGGPTAMPFLWGRDPASAMSTLWLRAP